MPAARAEALLAGDEYADAVQLQRTIWGWEDLDILPVARLQLGPGRGDSDTGNVYAQAVLSSWLSSGEGESGQPDPDELSRLAGVTLADTEDCPVFGLAEEKVKLALRSGYSLFDKMAFFRHFSLNPTGSSPSRNSIRCHRLRN